MARATDMNQESLFMESPCILFLLACSVLRQKYTMRQTPICSCCQNVCSSSRWTHTWLLSLGCSTILSSRKLFVVAQRQRQYPTKSVARSCWKFRRKPFSDRTLINYAQSGVFKSAATAVFSITILNMSKKIKEYSGMIQISWQSVKVLDITKKETEINYMFFISLLSKAWFHDKRLLFF